MKPSIVCLTNVRRRDQIAQLLRDKVEVCTPNFDLLQAERALRSRAPEILSADCVLVSHDPPEQSVMDVLVLLQDSEGRPILPIVVVASNLAALDRKAALRAGAMVCVDLDEGQLAGPLSDVGATKRLYEAIEEAVERFDVLAYWVEEAPAGTAHLDAEVTRDITQIERTEEQLRLPEHFTRRVLDQLFAFVGVLELDGTLIEANRAPLEAAGIDINDVRGKKFWEAYWWSYSEAVQDQLKDACARASAGEVVRYDVIVRMAGDSRRVIDFQIAPLYDGDRITHLIPSAVDVTDRRNAEVALRESEARAHALADNMSQLAWMADENGAIFWYNRRWFEYTGTSLEEMEGWGWMRLHAPDHVDRVVTKFRRHLQSGEPWEDTFPLRGQDGEFRWFLSRAIPIRDDAGRVVRWFGTNTDVTEQRQAEESLREADRRKDEFLAVLAHELRNPLAPVRTAVHLLRLVGAPPGSHERARDVIDRQVSHMARLIDDLIDVSRISRGKFDLQKEACDIAAIARQTMEDFRGTLEHSGLTAVVTGVAGPVWVSGDPVRITQMIGNLLHNAGRFTERGGQVELEVRADLDKLMANISVRDDGIGMDEALLARLFDPFAQADQGLARTKGGLGLGLALTRGIAELHGGGVDARSEGPGKGSTFTLSIPLLRARYPSPGRRATSSDGRRLSILVVEDNEDTAEMLCELLTVAGHRVHIALDAISGIEAARKHQPEVIISDIGLPGRLNGYDLARTLRLDGSMGRAFLIALSGYAQDEIRRRSREAGFDAHFVKPPDIHELELLLSRVPRRPSGEPASGHC